MPFTWYLKDYGLGVFAIYIVFTYFVRNIYVFFTVSSKILQKGILALNFHLQRFQCNLHAIYMLLSKFACACKFIDFSSGLFWGVSHWYKRSQLSLGMP